MNMHVNELHSLCESDVHDTWGLAWVVLKAT